MTGAAAPWVRLLAGHVVVTGAIVATLGIYLGEPRVAWPVALASGAAAGLALTLVLAGGFPPRERTVAADRRLVLVCAVVVVASACEEIVWRGFGIGELSGTLGTVAAFVVSTAGFALAHAGRVSTLTHLATGAAFGGVFLATGSLLAAIAAHATYNLLVVLAVGSSRTAQPAMIGLRSDTRPRTALAVEARGVVKRYRSTEALRGFDLDVRPGEVVALLGPNGSGKTTAVQILLGLRRADAGEVRVLGDPPGSLRARQRIGVTLQETGAPELLRVRELVSFVGAHYARPRTTESLLDQFGLAEAAGRQVGGLSGGQRQRLALALAFAGNPELLFLDEPTTGLDVESRLQVWAALRDFASHGGTILLTTHNLHEAEALASRIAVVRVGRVVAVGPAAEIKTELGAASLEDAFLRLTGSGR